MIEISQMHAISPFMATNELPKVLRAALIACYGAS